MCLKPPQHNSLSSITVGRDRNLNIIAINNNKTLFVRMRYCDRASQRLLQICGTVHTDYSFDVTRAGPRSQNIVMISMIFRIFGRGHDACSKRGDVTSTITRHTYTRRVVSASRTRVGRMGGGTLTVHCTRAECAAETFCSRHRISIDDQSNFLTRRPLMGFFLNNGHTVVVVYADR